MPEGLNDEDRHRIRREWAESPRGREVHESVMKHRKSQNTQEDSLMDVLLAVALALAACAIIFLMIVGAVNYFS